MQHIFIGFVAHSASIIKDHLSIVVVEALLDELCSGMVVRLAFEELTNERLGFLQVRRCQ